MGLCCCCACVAGFLRIALAERLRTAFSYNSLVLGMVLNVTGLHAVSGWRPVVGCDPSVTIFLPPSVVKVLMVVNNSERLAIRITNENHLLKKSIFRRKIP